MNTLGIRFIKYVICMLLMSCPSIVIAASPSLSVSDFGVGINRVVSVTSPGLFKLAFEATENFGLSRWYDLVNDPAMTNDLAQSHDTLIKTNPGMKYNEGGSLFTQIFNPLDVQSTNFVDQSILNANPQYAATINIIESNSLRIIIDTLQYPKISNTYYSDVTLATRYTIYPDGKIFITNTLHSTGSRTINEWRKATLQLADPTATALSNRPDPTGWIRAASTYNLGSSGATTEQNPAGNYYNQSIVFKYLFMYWNPATPAFENFTKASVLLAPSASNDPTYSGSLGTHGNTGYKRLFYTVNTPFSLTPGMDITQQYMIQLGAANNNVLPDIKNKSVADPFVDDYINSSSLIMSKGSVAGNGYDLSEGAYTMSADFNEVRFGFNGSNYRRIRPVFKIINYNSSKEPQIAIDGQIKTIGADFTASLASSSTLIVRLHGDISSNANISLSEGVADLPQPVTDVQAPSTPIGLKALAASATELNLSWNASTDNKDVAGYSIYRDGVLLAAQNGTTFNDSVLTEGVTYNYYVVAFDSAGNLSAPTSTVSAKTQTAAPPVTIARKNYGILDYNSNTSDTILNWIKDRFSFKVSGKSPSTSDIHWDTYFDIYGPASLSGLLSLKDWAAANGVVAEDVLLHAKVDYTSAIATAWSQMDKFDNFEGAKGVMRTSDDITFTDLTSTAYSGNVSWQNTMYIGYEEPFDQVNLVFSTPGSGITRSWEYWNGSSWTTLPVTDGTSNLTVSGQVAFTPPSDWVRKVVNSSRNKYFIRCRITVATTNAVTSSVKGDNWLRGSGKLCRGWDAASGSIINSGELAYNPSPPATASAKFRYQARISYWAANHFVANPADFQLIGGNNARTWAKFVASVINTMVATSGYTGVMCDDGERDVASDGIASSNTDFVNKTANPWLTESINKYGDIVAYTHALNPATKVGINAQDKNIVKKGDWNLAEYHTANWKTNSARGIPMSDSSLIMNYDDYLPANNPNGIIGLIIYQDTENIVPNKTAMWDRGNRGPIVALSKHYIAMNDNTVFSYYSQGGFVYNNTDEVFLKDGSIRHQSTDPIPTVDLVTRWATYFPAMGVDIGVPDSSGYNGGVRLFAWKSHTEIGGLQDVWRRDFTQAIVIHRPASWNTTDDEYNTYSSSIYLGGTYYPLMADGTTGPGVSSIALRTGEGAILMKVPQAASPPPPSIPPPSSTAPPTAPKGVKILK